MTQMQAVLSSKMWNRHAPDDPFNLSSNMQETRQGSRNSRAAFNSTYLSGHQHFKSSKFSKSLKEAPQVHTSQMTALDANLAKMQEDKEAKQRLHSRDGSLAGSTRPLFLEQMKRENVVKTNKTQVLRREKTTQFNLAQTRNLVVKPMSSGYVFNRMQVHNEYYQKCKAQKYIQEMNQIHQTQRTISPEPF